MIIQSLHIQSFGGLRDFDLTLSDGANLIAGEANNLNPQT